MPDLSSCASVGTARPEILKFWLVSLMVRETLARCPHFSALAVHFGFHSRASCCASAICAGVINHASESRFATASFSPCAAVLLGTLYTVAAKTQIPISYLTTGQKVPEDIEPADGVRLASLVMNSLSS